MGSNATIPGLLSTQSFLSGNMSTAAYLYASGNSGGSHGPAGVALMAWNFKEVEFTLVASLFFLAVAIGKICVPHYFNLLNTIF